MELPNSIQEINKAAKTTKITTLDKAHSFRLKRMFSGSILIDALSGGGWGFKKIHMLYGYKSCLDGDSFLLYEVWVNGKRINSKGGSLQRLYERFTGDISEGSKYGRHLQNNNAIFYCKSVDDMGRVIKNEVLDVVKCGKKECYEVRTASGNELISTMEHKYLTPEGYKELKDIKIGDILFIHTNKYKVKGRKNYIHRPSLCVKYHPYFPTKIVKDKYKGKETDYIYYRGQKSRIAYEAFLNNMTYENYVNFLNTQTKEEINKLNFLPENIHVHHKDENFLNNNIDNLELIDPSEHGKLHMKDKTKHVQIIVEETHITSIEYIGERETYDLKCAYPYNNYIANRIVVHNSGKNAILNQTIAYNQRICRHCNGILPEDYNNTTDRHSVFLRYVLGVPECKCDNAVGRIFWILDYEKSLSMEGQRIVVVKNIIDKKTDEKISEEIYEEKLARLEEVSSRKNLDDSDTAEIKSIEKWLKNLNIEEQEIIQDSTTDYLIKCGVKTDNLLVSDPDSTEEGIDMVRPIIKERAADGIIWDSVQASVPKYVRDRDAENATMGVDARQNGLLMRHIFSAFAASDLTDERESYKPAFFMNSQMRSSLGGFIAKQDSFSGGHSIAHANSLILEVKKEKFIKKDGTEVANFKETFVGQKIRLRAEKNKLAAPGDMYEITYYFRDGDFCRVGEIDHTQEIITLGIEKGKIERSGNTYIVTENDKFVGIEKLTTFFRQNPEFVGRVYKMIKE